MNLKTFQIIWKRKRYLNIFFVVICFAVVGTLCLSITAKDKFDVLFYNISIEIDHEDLFREASADVYIHSAFWDTRQTPYVVRIIAIAPKFHSNELQELRCFLRYDSRIVVTEFKKAILKHHMQMQYAVVFYTCESPYLSKPTAVLISRTRTILQETVDRKWPLWKAVKDITIIDRNANDLAVCVRPFFGPFRNTLALAEFLAYYEMMGVKHFLFADLDTSTEVVRFIKALQDVKTKTFTIEFLPWNLPPLVDAWQYGQVALNQYCVLKLMPRYKYVTMIDVDEFLVPRTVNQTLLSLIMANDRNKIGNFMFRNAFFCDYSKIKNSQKKTENQNAFDYLRVSRDVLRNREICVADIRTKLVVKPESVVEVGIHFVWEFIPGFETFVFDPNVAVMNHYRDEYCETSDTMLDSFASDNFGVRIMLSKIFSILKNVTVMKL